jgi:phosphoribosylformylglycinamidine cyclo-ligase
MSKSLTYREAGVDVAKGEAFVRAIGSLARSTDRPGVVGTIGGFGGLFRAPKGMKDPLLVASTDGVGTKVLVAQQAGKHDTVGIDLVAMCVNDVVVCGAEPLFFLDYLGVGGLDLAQARDLVKGVARGCREAGCALIGGETAEMPDLYAPGHYDLAGFAVGVVDRSKLIDGRKVRVGDVLLGLPSSGLHSSGFSLARRVFSAADVRGKWGSTLLKPTRIYVRPLLALARAGVMRAASHITGGGFHGNIPRCLPTKRSAQINRKAWRIPAIFREVQRRGNVSDEEMFRTFNMGIGMVVVVGAADVDRATRLLAPHRLKPVILGNVVAGDGSVIFD